MRLFWWAGPCTQGCCIRHSKLSLRFLSPLTTFSFPHRAYTLFKPLFGQSIHRKDCFSLSTPASPFFPCHWVGNLLIILFFTCILGCDFFGGRVLAPKGAAFVIRNYLFAFFPLLLLSHFLIGLALCLSRCSGNPFTERIAFPSQPPHLPSFLVIRSVIYLLSFFSLVS